MEYLVRKYNKKDLNEMLVIWNEIVDRGIYFPQENKFDKVNAGKFFDSQSYCAVAEEVDTHKIVGLYIIHPNNVGRCNHICNASYGVLKEYRGKHIGEQMVLDCLGRAKELGFMILQFNAVLANNTRARDLYERVGFHQLGVIPKGFRTKDGTYEDICPYYIEL